MEINLAVRRMNWKRKRVDMGRVAQNVEVWPILASGYNSEFKLWQEKCVKGTGAGRIDQLTTKYIFHCKILELILIITVSKSPDVVLCNLNASTISTTKLSCSVTVNTTVRLRSDQMFRTLKKYNGKPIEIQKKKKCLDTSSVSISILCIPILF